MEKGSEMANSDCGDCGMLLREPGEFHPYALCAMTKRLGSHSARINLAAVIEYARSDDPVTRQRVDQFLASVEKERWNG